MRLHMNAADVRRLVTHYFLDLGVDNADVDDPHREHLRDAIAPSDAPTPIDPDVLLEIIDVGGVHTEVEEVMRDQPPHVRGIHVQTHGRQPPVAGCRVSELSNDFLSIGSGNLLRSGRRRKTVFFRP
ncbi:MAG: hypothetical protein ACKOHK_05445, partial [Planctomycetia bacterium]